MDILFLAGHRAYERIRAGGLSADDVKMVVGASGAAKWLVLHGLESVLFGQWFTGRKKPLHLYEQGLLRKSQALREAVQRGLREPLQS